MPKKGGNISLSSYDDIFQTDQSREEAQQERVQEIKLSDLHPFKGHPFKVVDDEAMQKTVESIAQFGVMTPAIARPRPEGGYELIAGHRRHHASELAGKETMPVIVRDMDDDAATILMVDSNLQRETLLPSERAFAYKMKLEAIKHQGQRTDLTSSQVGMKLQAMDIVGQEAGDSRNQVHRYIRLTELIPELLDMVDEKKIAFNPAVEISYLKPNEQQDFLEAMDYDEATFLKELHSIEIDCSVSLFSDALVNKKDKFLQDKKLLISILEKEQLLTDEMLEHIETIYENILSNAVLFKYTPCLVHNDFSANNMIFRNNRLFGVIDFGDFNVGDPDNDFLCLLDCSTDDFGKEFGRKVLKYYQHKAPEVAERKAELNDVYWLIDQIIYGYERKDREMLIKGVSELLQTQAEMFIF